jgi:hypothetical protein
VELIISSLLIAISILLYAFGFYIGTKQKQSISVYYILLTIQAIVLIMELFQVGYSGGSDAMGNGMERGFLQLGYICVQILLAITLLVVFIRKVARHR